MNKTVIRLLEESLGGKPKPARSLHHDLDHLAGAWSRRQADAFDRALRRQRQIDPDIWQ